MPILSTNRTQIFSALIILIALTHAAFFLPVPHVWQSVAALLLTGLLPGLLLTWLLATPLPLNNRPPHKDQSLGLEADSIATSGQSLLPELRFLSGEHILYGLGAGYGMMVIGMLVLSYLPGGIAWWQTLLTFDVLLGVLLILVFRQVQPTVDPVNIPSKNSSGQAQRWIIAGLLILAIFGGYFRFADLAYSEFQGDEARAVLRAAEAIQGYRDALLGHKKGPTEILVPAVTYSLSGHINEAAARLPFTIANLAGLFAIYLLGMRLFGPLTGWVAAMLLAVDGYFIGFSHIVQYQSIVFLCVVLTILILHRLIQGSYGSSNSRSSSRSSSSLAIPRGEISRWGTLAAFILATGLLAHYEAALVLFPAIFLVVLLWKKVGWRAILPGLAAPIAVGTAILSLFYVPFVLNPNFGITIAYITVNRIGVNRESGGFPYNNLVNVFERTALYSSTYYLLFLIGITVFALSVLLWRNFPKPWRRIVIALWLAGVLLTFWRPDWGVIPGLVEGRNDYTWLFFAVAMLAAWLLPNIRWQERTLWLWFGGPMILSLFFIATPNTHVYGFFIAWVLIVGLTVERIWRWMRENLSLNSARAIAIPTAAALMLLFGTYEYWYFVHNQVEVLRTWEDNRPSGYWVPYSMPTNMSIFGFPFRNGWKAVGALYEEGTLDGAFTTNGRDAVADWYTRGQAYCPRDHRYYIYSQAVEPAEAGRLAQLRQELEEKYDLWGTVTVAGEERLRIYEQPKGAMPTNDGPQQIALEAYETHFDDTLSGPIFERGGPIGEALAEQTIGHPLDFWFGALPDDPNRAIRLRGFTLANETINPGQEVELTLYWEAHQPTKRPYSITTQLIDPNDSRKVGQNDGEPVCNLRPTQYWLPGELFADRYRIPVDPDAAAGTYQVLIGIYDGETGERLEAFTAEGNSAGSGLGVSQVDVVLP